MSYFRTCPICGANLDPGERCDCIKNTAHGEATPKAAGNQHMANYIITIIPKGGQSVNGLHA